MATELPEKLLDLGEERSDDAETDAERSDEEPEERERFVVFELGHTRYAVPVERVRSVVEPGEYTRVPRSSDAIEGVTDLRGDITAIIDPRVHFEVGEPVRDEDDERVLVFERPPDKQSAGIRVDRVAGVESVPVSRIFREPAPEEGVEAGRLDHDLVRAVISTPVGEDEFDRVTLIDVEALVRASGNN